ncbi:MAG: redox-regulated ATPase YchF [Deltaproteobacteria bacterium]|nr:redox-regulated ATPase YchF [Deltaproteobacteria bacterium]
MGFNCGIVGLPNAGKSTIFNALTSARAAVAPYPFCTINPHEGIAPVPDLRLDKIARLTLPKKVTPTTLEVWDIAGLVKGASKGEGLGNQFLSHIRAVDALIHVVRCFEAEDVAGEGGVDPVRDADIVNTELLLSDVEIVARRIAKLSKLVKTGDKDARDEVEIAEKLDDRLNNGIPARRIDEHVTGYARDLGLLTVKPMLYVANISEPGEGASSDYAKALDDLAKRENVPAVTICGKLEDELQELDEEEKQSFLREYGIERSGLETLITAGYRLLGLITFYTVVSDELRAWTVKKGTKAPQAAGKIHTDMERGFIKAEVICFDDFIEAGSLHHAREKGAIGLEGKEYEVSDGDIVTFKFNV